MMARPRTPCTHLLAWLAGIILLLAAAACGGGGADARALPPAPVITAFTCDPSPIAAVQTSMLHWTVTGAASLSLDQGIGPVAGNALAVTPASTTTYTLTAGNAGGSVTGAVTVSVGPAAAITGFTAARTTITAGSSTTLTPTFANAGAATIDQGVGAVTSGTAFTVTPAATTTYTLTADGLGAPATRTVTVVVVDPAQIQSFSASPATVPAGGSSQLVAAFSGGAGVVDQGIGPVANGVAVATGPLGSSLTYTLTVTNAAGDAVTARTTVTAGPAVAITGFAPARSPVTAGTSTTLTASFVNATSAAIDQGVGPVTSGAAFTVTPAATTTYTLTVNGLGGPATRTATVVVADPAQVQSFAASPGTVVTGGSSQLTATFTGVTGSIDHGIGPVTSGVPVDTGPLAASTTYTLTVTNAALDTATAQATVIAGPAVAITGFAAARTTITAGSATTLTPAFVNADSAAIDNNVGPVTAGIPVSVSPPVTTTYTLTAAGVGGPVSRTVQVVVVAPAAIQSFTAVPGEIAAGGSSQLTATFYGGAGAIDSNIGSVTSGVPVSTGPLAASTSYTLTVTNAAGDAVTASAGVVADYQVSFAAAGAGSVSGATVQTVASGGSTSPVQANPSPGFGFVNWTGTGGFAATTANPLTVAGVTSGMAISANFAQIPVIVSFTAAAPAINLGQSTSLSWSGVNFFSSASISPAPTGLPGGIVASPNGGPFPVTPLATTTYTLTATSAGGTAHASVTITVVQPPALSSFTASPSTITVGQTSTLSWLSAGATSLGIDQNVGSVTGASVDVSPAATTTYTLTVANSAGTRTATATVTVLAVPPAGLAYSANPAVFTRGAAISPDLPSSAGGPIAGYTVAPALPSGLSLAPGTGIITGQPSVLGSGTYTVTGTNTGGHASVDLAITVDDPPPAISYPGGSRTFSEGTAITTLVPGNAGGPAVTWSIAPPLPAGLGFSLADGTISGTPLAPAAAQDYTVTAGNSGGSSQTTVNLKVNPPPPVITVQPFSQILPLDAVPVFSVTASCTGAPSYQWWKSGSAIPGATLSSYTAPALAAGDDGATYQVVVSDPGGQSVTSAIATLSVQQDLAAWLGGHPAVAGAIQWQFQPGSSPGLGVYSPPAATDKIAWSAWSPSQQADLDQAYRSACAWFSAGAQQAPLTPGVEPTDEPVNQYGNQSDGISTMEWLSTGDFWTLYTSHVAFSLMLEIYHVVPWTVADYPAPTLRYLFDSSVMGWYMTNGWVSLGTYGQAYLPALRADNRPRTTFGDPKWTYPWLRQAGIPGATRLASIGAVLDWMRHNLWHFFDVDDFGRDFAVWQYRGYSPLSRIINGTVDSGNPGYGVQHWTAGCHGSVGFMHAILRALNIPVQPIWIGGHEAAWFMSEDLYLDHGDDPYNLDVIASPDPSLDLLISSATYQTLFTTDLTANIADASGPAAANVGWIVNHLP